MSEEKKFFVVNAVKNRIIDFLKRYNIHYYTSNGNIFFVIMNHKFGVYIKPKNGRVRLELVRDGELVYSTGDWRKIIQFLFMDEKIGRFLMDKVEINSNIRALKSLWLTGKMVKIMKLMVKKGYALTESEALRYLILRGIESLALIDDDIATILKGDYDEEED